MNKSKGFTLVEIIVSLAIFSIVAVVALGALVKIISANNKAQTLQSAISNLNYAMESISREVRVGKTYYCSTTIPIGNELITGSNSCAGGELLSDPTSDNSIYVAFNPPQKSSDLCYKYIIYRFNVKTGANNTGIQKWKQKECSDTPSEAAFYPIIDSNVILDEAFIQLSPGISPAPSGKYSIMTMRFSGHAGVREREKTYFDLQTSVYARVQQL